MQFQNRPPCATTRHGSTTAYQFHNRVAVPQRTSASRGSTTHPRVCNGDRLWNREAVVHDSFHNRLAVPQAVTLQNRKGGSRRGGGRWNVNVSRSNVLSEHFWKRPGCGARWAGSGDVRSAGGHDDGAARSAHSARNGDRGGERRSLTALRADEARVIMLLRGMANNLAVGMGAASSKFPPGLLRGSTPHSRGGPDAPPPWWLKSNFDQRK